MSTTYSPNIQTSSRCVTPFSFTFEVRQIMFQISSSLQRERHFCSDANPYAIGRRGLRRNKNVWAAASFDLSHFELESTHSFVSDVTCLGLAGARARCCTCVFRFRAVAFSQMTPPNMRIGGKFYVFLAAFTPPNMFQALITVAPAAGRETKIVASMPVLFL